MKKHLFIFSFVIMVFSLMAIGALADDSAAFPTENVTEVATVEEFNTAITEKKSNIKLTADIIGADKILVSQRSLNLDLNGFELQFVPTARVDDEDIAYIYVRWSQGSFSLYDSSTNCTGKITQASNDDSGRGLLHINNVISVCIYGGTIDGWNLSSDVSLFTNFWSQIHFYGGKITNCSATSGLIYVKVLADNPDLGIFIYDGYEFLNNEGIIFSGGNGVSYPACFYINGGTFIGPITTDFVGEGSFVKITDGLFSSHPSTNYYDTDLYEAVAEGDLFRVQAIDTSEGGDVESKPETDFIVTTDSENGHTVIYSNGIPTTDFTYIHSFSNTSFQLADRLVSFSLSFPRLNYTERDNFAELVAYVRIGGVDYPLFDIRAMKKSVHVNGIEVNNSQGYNFCFARRNSSSSGNSCATLNVCYYLDTVNSKLFLIFSSDINATYATAIDIDLTGVDLNSADNNFLCFNFPVAESFDDPVGNVNAAGAWQVDIGIPTVVDVPHSPFYNILYNSVPSDNLAYQEGYNDGYDVGYDEGYDVGSLDNSSYDNGYTDGYNEATAERNEYYSGYISPSQLEADYLSKTYVSANFKPNAVVEREYFTKIYVEQFYVSKTTVSLGYISKSIVERDYMLKVDRDTIFQEGYAKCVEDYKGAETAVVGVVGGIFDGLVDAFTTVTQGVTLFGFSLHTIFLTIISLAVIAICCKLFIFK